MSDKYVCDEILNPDSGIKVWKLHPNSPHRASGYDSPDDAVQGVLATLRQEAKRTKELADAMAAKHATAEKAFAAFQAAVIAGRVVVR